jgi:hypothetical protein
MAGTEPHAWETARMNSITYVGLDVHKATVAVAEGGRGGEVRQVGLGASPCWARNPVTASSLISRVTQRCIASGLAMFFGASLQIVLSSIDTIFIEIGTVLARGARILRQASPCTHCPQSALVSPSRSHTKETTSGPPKRRKGHGKAGHCRGA